MINNLTGDGVDGTGSGSSPTVSIADLRALSIVVADLADARLMDEAWRRASIAVIQLE